MDWVWCWFAWVFVHSPQVTETGGRGGGAGNGARASYVALLSASGEGRLYPPQIPRLDLVLPNRKFSKGQGRRKPGIGRIDAQGVPAMFFLVFSWFTEDAYTCIPAFLWLTRSHSTSIFSPPQMRAESFPMSVLNTSENTGLHFQKVPYETLHKPKRKYRQLKLRRRNNMKISRFVKFSEDSKKLYTGSFEPVIIPPHPQAGWLGQHCLVHPWHPTLVSADKSRVDTQEQFSPALSAGQAKRQLLYSKLIISHLWGCSNNSGFGAGTHSFADFSDGQPSEEAPANNLLIWFSLEWFKNFQFYHPVLIKRQMQEYG